MTGVREGWGIWGVCALALAVCLLMAGCTVGPASDGRSSRSSTATPSMTAGSSSTAASATPSGSPSAKPVTLRVLAGSEVKDMTPVLTAAAQATNVRLTVAYTGTLDGSQTVASGKAAGKYDAVWFPSNRYLSLLQGASRQLGTSTKIMTSPVALGLNRSVARRLHWDRTPPTWQQITRAAEQKKFRFGMTDPSASNSGLSALVGVATALSGGGAALDADRVTAVAPDLRRLFRAQTLTSGSSGWLADQFAKKAGRQDGPHGLINYESVLLSLNSSGSLREPLTVITPADGVVTADYPLTLLGDANDEVRDAYAVLTRWLRSPEAQQMIMEQTSRRPAVPAVPLDKRFGDRLLIELPFPAQRAVVDELITAYLNTVRRATQTIYVLDLSGSMRGPRIEAMRAALLGLAGSGSTSSRRFAVFRERETVSVIGYSDKPDRARTFTIPVGRSKPARAKIRGAVRDLQSGGNTATWSALRAGYRLAARQVEDRPGALTSIVLMTDGETNRGISAGQFRRYYRDLPRSARAVPTFTVKFGPVDADSLARTARLTGGESFEADEPNLARIFAEIRAYQ